MQVSMLHDSMKKEQQKMWLGVVLAFVAGFATCKLTVTDRGGWRPFTGGSRAEQPHKGSRAEHLRRGERMPPRDGSKFESIRKDWKKKQGKKKPSMGLDGLGHPQVGPWYAPGYEPTGYNKWAEEWEYPKGGDETCSLYLQWVADKKK